MKNLFSNVDKPVFKTDAITTEARRAEMARLTQIEVNNRHSAPQKTVTAIPVRMFDEIPTMDGEQGCLF